MNKINLLILACLITSCSSTVNEKVAVKSPNEIFEELTKSSHSSYEDSRTFLKKCTDAELDAFLVKLLENNFVMDSNISDTRSTIYLRPVLKELGYRLPVQTLDALSEKLKENNKYFPIVHSYSQFVLQGAVDKDPKLESKLRSDYSGLLNNSSDTVKKSKLDFATVELKNYLKSLMRIKGNEFAVLDKSYAKLVGDRAVFYMHVTPVFMEKPKEYRQEFADGIRKFWGLRCENNGVTSRAESYLDTFYNGKSEGVPN